MLSLGPVHYGPVFLFRNVAWATGADGTGKDGEGRAPGSVMVKYSGTSNPMARVYLLHNTFWTDRPSVSGGAQFASTGSSAGRASGGSARCPTASSSRSRRSPRATVP